MSTHWFFQRHDNIAIYIPNLIGYLRLVLSFYAFWVAQSNPFHCILSYTFGFICDDLDGRFARLLNQTSLLGHVLDMVTDRLFTAGLFVILSMLYQEYYFGFLFLLMLDIFSHWVQMYYGLKTGKTTHKDQNSKSWLVRIYYKYRIFMGICCISCEVLYLALYFVHWLEEGDAKRSLVMRLILLTIPGFFTKQVINVFQLKNAMTGLIQYENNIQKNNDNTKFH